MAPLHHIILGVALYEGRTAERVNYIIQIVDYLTCLKHLLTLAVTLFGNILRHQHGLLVCGKSLLLHYTSYFDANIYLIILQCFQVYFQVWFYTCIF